MREYVVESANEMYLRMLPDLLQQPKLSLGPVAITFLNTSRCVATLPGLPSEGIPVVMDWYEAKVPHLGMSKKAAYWKASVNAMAPTRNPGYVIAYRRKGQCSQLETCLDDLQVKSTAVLDFRQYPWEWSSYERSLWKPSLLSQTFSVQEGEVTSVVLETNAEIFDDLFFDLPWIASLQARLAENLGHAKLGQLVVVVDRVYVSEKSVSLAEKLLRGRES